MDFDDVMASMVSEITSRTYDPSMDFAQGVEPIVFCDFIEDGALILSNVAAGAETAAEGSSPGFDSRPKAGSPCAGKPASRSTRVPPRIAERPRTEEWTDDELLTLPEAAALFWPTGPITTNTLRTAGRDGSLAITKVAGKFFTTPMAIRRMGVDETGAVPAPVKPDAVSAQAVFQQKLEEARRFGRERKPRQRAAKRPVAPAVNGRAGQ